MLLLTMFLVALAGVALATVGVVWHSASRREKEAQLLFVGDEFRRALASYRAATPPGMPALPERLEQLVLDTRQPVPRRHLRRIYRDPLTDGTEWGLIKEGGRIAAIYSLGVGAPAKQAGFPTWAGGFSGATTYAAWRFHAATRDAEVGPEFGAGHNTSSLAADPAEAAGNRATPPSAANDSDSRNQDTASRCAEAFLAAMQQCIPLRHYVERGHCRTSVVSEYRQCIGG